MFSCIDILHTQYIINLSAMFKKIMKWTSIILLVVIVGVAITVAARQNLTYEAPLPDIVLSTDSAVLAMGKAGVHRTAGRVGKLGRSSYSSTRLIKKINSF